MKKLSIILAALLIACAFAGCSSQSKPEADNDSGTQTEAQIPAEDMTPAQMVVADFKAKAESAESAEALAQSLVENENIPFAGAYMAVEEGPLNGFDGEIKGFSEGATFGPMIGSIPFIGYVFVLEDGADVNAFMNTLKDQANMRWNVCTSADEMICDSVGNTVVFVMSPLTFEE